MHGAFGAWARDRLSQPFRRHRLVLFTRVTSNLSILTFPVLKDRALGVKWINVMALAKLVTASSTECDVILLPNVRSVSGAATISAGRSQCSSELGFYSCSQVVGARSHQHSTGLLESQDAATSRARYPIHFT